MFRVHQFDKVEMFVFCRPEDSAEEHERLLATEEALIGELGIPYRGSTSPPATLGASARKKYDIEGWFPGQGRYRELTSTSNTTDYQSRRLEIRSAPTPASSSCHTLNGTAVTARAMIAILENYQDDGGAVSVPEVLVGFGAPKRIEPGD